MHRYDVVHRNLVLCIDPCVLHLSSRGPAVMHSTRTNRVLGSRPNHRNSRTRMLGPSRDIVIPWGSKMVACDGKKLKREYKTSVEYCEVCQNL